MSLGRCLVGGRRSCRIVQRSCFLYESSSLSQVCSIFNRFGPISAIGEPETASSLKRPSRNCDKCFPYSKQTHSLKSSLAIFVGALIATAFASLVTNCCGSRLLGQKLSDCGIGCFSCGSEFSVLFSRYQL